MPQLAYDRRAFRGYFASIGLGTSLLPGVLWAKLTAGAEITKETIAAAEEIAGVHFSDAQRAMMLNKLKRQAQSTDALHKLNVQNDVAPALVFDPIPPGEHVTIAAKRPAVRGRVPVMT